MQPGNKMARCVKSCSITHSDTGAGPQLSRQERELDHNFQDRKAKNESVNQTGAEPAKEDTRAWLD